MSFTIRLLFYLRNMPKIRRIYSSNSSFENFVELKKQK